MAEITAKDIPDLNKLLAEKKIDDNKILQRVRFLPDHPVLNLRRENGFLREERNSLLILAKNSEGSCG